MGPCPNTNVSRRTRRPAVHARPDGKGHGAALSSEPRRDHRTEATGRTPCRHQEQVLGVGQGPVLVVAPVAHHPALAHVGPFAAADAGPIVEPAAHVRAREAGGGGCGPDRGAGGTRPRA